MVTVTEIKENFATPESRTEDSLREERRRTGRYVATVIAIFVSLFGLYQAMARGTPEYAAFFLPALIMFFYVLWILYASRSRSKSYGGELQNEETSGDIEVGVDNPAVTTTSPTPKPSTSDNLHTFCRSYSVA